MYSCVPWPDPDNEVFVISRIQHLFVCPSVVTSSILYQLLTGYIMK